MKIAFFEINKGEDKKIKSLLDNGHELHFSSEKLSPANVDEAKDADIISVFVGSEINSNIIDAIPNLKMILTRSMGFDHVDTKYADSKNILVSNVPAYGARTVAEHAFALIMEISRKVGLASFKVKESDDFGIDMMQFKGFDLSGKTLGIIGTGKIGKNIVKIANGFSMKIIATDLYPDYVFAEEAGFEYVPLEVLLSASDIITIHAPYNESTHHLINKNNIDSIKKGAYLINTARGELVDSEALLQALENRIISGAGLDVLEGERKLKNEKSETLADLNEEDREKSKIAHEIIKLPNVVITPHIAFCTTEAIEEILKITAININSFTSGTPENLVK